MPKTSHSQKSPQDAAKYFTARLREDYPNINGEMALLIEKAWLDGFESGKRKRDHRYLKRKERAEQALAEALQRIPEAWHAIITTWVEHCRDIDGRMFLKADAIVHDYEELHQYVGEDMSAAQKILVKSTDKPYKSWAIPFVAKLVKKPATDTTATKDSQGQLEFDEKPARPTVSKLKQNAYDNAVRMLYQKVCASQGENEAKRAYSDYWRFMELYNAVDDGRAMAVTLLVPNRWFAEHFLDEWGDAFTDCMKNVSLFSNISLQFAIKEE